MLTKLLFLPEAASVALESFFSNVLSAQTGIAGFLRASIVIQHEDGKSLSFDSFGDGHPKWHSPDQLQVFPAL
jgi:hypothetical protein